MRGIYLRVLDAEDKATALLDATQSRTRDDRRFRARPADFNAVPGSPFAYWLSDRLRRLFAEWPPVENASRIVRQGGVTGNDDRFLRLAWEVDCVHYTQPSFSWKPFAKGGKLSRWYADIPSVVIWDVRRGTFGGYTGLKHRPSEKPSSADHYFRPGLTWPLRASRFAPVPLPAKSVFSIRGYALLDERDELLSICAIGNSEVFDRLFKVALGRSGFPEFVVGVLQKMPMPAASAQIRKELGALAWRAWSSRRSLDTRTETSHAYTLPALLQVPGNTLAVRAAAWVDHVCGVEEGLTTIQAEIDARCFDLYDIDEADRLAITGGFGTLAAETSPAPDAEVGPDDENDTEGADDAETALADATSLTAELISWAAGVAFGRFDVRLATGERTAPPEPDPFDPLPVCSPGMLTGDDGLPLAGPHPGYPLAFPPDGVLVDEPGHSRDLTAAVRAVFDVVFGSDSDAWWRESAELLDPKGHDLRAWLSGSFIEHHLKHYSKSRRKAPILWQLATPSGSYSLWLYAHRLTSDTFFHLQNEYVGPKLAHEERKLTALGQDGGPNPTATARKAIDKQETFVEELRALREEVARVAPLWKPDLNDGVFLTAAPLWRLVPQHRAWQKELRSAWESLATGKYDWAHLAMHLWPERVVPKCATDRSLAIAHGLEGVFWVEGSDGKWKARPKPTRPVAELVVERSSVAIKAALKSLLEASPSGAHGPRRSTRSRGAR